MVVLISALGCKLAKFLGLKPRCSPNPASLPKAMHEQELAKTSSLSSHTASNSSTLDQQHPLMGPPASDQSPTNHRSNLLDSTARRLRMLGINRYSMGVDGNKPEDPASAITSDRCCCGHVRITTAAYLIAFIELIIIVYHLFLAMWNYDKTGDDYAFSFILGVFCMGLALVAVVLMVIGIRKSSPYFLVPHLLMQFAIIVSWTLLAGYLILLMIGGTSIKLKINVYEDSERGRLGLENIDRQEPIKAQAAAQGLNLLLVSLLGLTVFFIAVQIWLFTIIRRCFIHFRASMQSKRNGII